MRELELTETQIDDLKRVGFWWSPEEFDLPHPRDYVDPSWDASERDRVLTYLKKSYTLTRFYCGYSWCRFGCSGGESWSTMGHGECTDGVWLFPEGFLHYLQHHEVKPPPDFLEHMRKMKFRVPKPTRGRLVTHSFRLPRHKPLPWSLDPPITPASYWFLPESSSRAILVDVSEINGELKFCWDDQPLQNCKGQWQGPVPPPLGKEVKPRGLLPKRKKD